MRFHMAIYWRHSAFYAYPFWWATPSWWRGDGFTDWRFGPFAYSSEHDGARPYGCEIVIAVLVIALVTCLLMALPFGVWR